MSELRARVPKYVICFCSLDMMINHSHYMFDIFRPRINKYKSVIFINSSVVRGQAYLWSPNPSIIHYAWESSTVSIQNIDFATPPPKKKKRQ
jgi:hypothetical protein